MARIKPPDTAFSLDPSGKDQSRIVDEAHLAFIRKLPSVISGKKPCEACHLRTGNPVYRKKRTGGAQKPDDAWSLPMTADEHRGPRGQHSMNEIEFYQKHGIQDPWRICVELYAVSGDLEAGRKVIAKYRGRRR